MVLLRSLTAQHNSTVTVHTVNDTADTKLHVTALVRYHSSTLGHPLLTDAPISIFIYH
jgi:hypothetical protein